jgi:Flp pilus assembly protein TadD
VLVAALVRQVSPRQLLQGSAWLVPSFVAGLLFALHPIHTEPVAWSAGINDLGLALFGLLAVWCHATASERGWTRDGWAAFAWLLALLCKETAVVIPVIAAAYDLIFVEPGKRARRLATGLWAFAFPAALYLGLRVNALGGLMPTAGGVGQSLGMSTYLLSVLALLAGYISKLVLPVKLNFWHAFAAPASLFSAEGLRAAGIIGLAAAGSIAAFSNPVVRFAVVLVVVPLLPTFHLGALNQGLENAFAERYLYLPSVGFVMLVALAVEALRVCARPRTAPVVAIVLALSGFYAAATVARNRVWKDHLSLWSDAVRKSPGSAVAQMNHGAALIYAGRGPEGTAAMRKAAAMNPALVDRELAKAAAYLEKGLYNKAILTLHTALALDPASAPAHYDLGLVYESLGQVEAAATEYSQALSLNPMYAEAHNNLGVLHAQQGNVDKALPHFREAVRLRPDDPQYRANLERAQRQLQ